MPNQTTPRILWNHRWEYDKNPTLFFDTLVSLSEQGVQFELVILGSATSKVPDIFKSSMEKLAGRIIHSGYLDSKDDYNQMLQSCTHLPVTSNQDFFGISAVEAIAQGCIPLLPKRLAFVEHLDPSLYPHYFYTSEEEYLTPILWRIWFDYMLPYHFRKHQIDVFYSPDGYGSLRTDVPTVLVSHDLAFEHFDDHNYSHHLRYLRKYAPRFHHKAKSIIAVSQATADDIIATYQIEPRKIHVAGNSTTIKRSDRADKSITDGKEYLVYIGSLNPRKNIERLIAAFDQYKAESGHETKLVIIGKLAWKSEPIRLAMNNAKYASDIIHLSDVGDSVSLLLSNATVLVYPSLFEGFGIPILEGFATGTPVITSDLSSMKEVAGDAALLVDPYSVDAIVQGLLELSSDPTLRQDLIY